MADGLSVAAGIIAVVDISVKVGTLCSTYYKKASKAREEISKVRKEVEELAGVLDDLKDLLRGQRAESLATTGKLRDAIEGARKQLVELEKKLSDGIAEKEMSRLGLRSLKWPFQAGEVERVLGDLEKCKQTLSFALQVDQT